MLHWRITKYNPKLRDSMGKYLKSDWTSCSDIGKVYDGKTLDAGCYMEIENAYIAAIITFMHCVKLEHLRISALEKHMHKQKHIIYTLPMIKIYKSIEQGDLITAEEIELIARLALREDLWCKLESEYLHVHFGYDYYMYISTEHSCQNAIENIEKSGLFVEGIEKLPLKCWVL